MAGLFDFEFRCDKIDKQGDPLVRLNELIDWEIFREELEQMRGTDRKSSSGRKPYDAVLMFKILVLQSLYNLSDEQMQFQILDRVSFMRFLKLNLEDSVPDEKTIWLFRDQLTKADKIHSLFERFNVYLEQKGYKAQKGQIIDASITPARIQRNTRDENETIKQGEVPEKWEENPNKLRQKDTDARWTQRGEGKAKRSFFGYKNHIGIDNKHKLIRSFAATDAALHDSQVTEILLDPNNTSKTVLADGAYVGCREDWTRDGYRPRVCDKGVRGRPLSESKKKKNTKIARTRARVEHVFGAQKMKTRDMLIRTVGWARAQTAIGLRNLTYNMNRFVTLELRAT